MPHLIQLNQEPNALAVEWSDGQSSRFPHFWLRDHATDPDSYDERTAQRELFTAVVAPDIQPESAELAEDGTSLLVCWPGTVEPSCYTAEFLQTFAAPEANAAQRRPQSWNADTLTMEAIRLDYSDVLSDDSGLQSLLETIDQHGFALLANCPRAVPAVERLANKIGYVRETIFGGAWDFEANEAMADSAFSPKEVRPHTDGTYSHDAPGVQMLLCLDYDAKGGDSIMVDGLEIVRRLQMETPDAYRTLTQVHVPGQYRGDGVHLLARRPVLRLGLEGEVVQVSFNNYDRAPFRLPDAEMAEFYEAIRAFDSLANDPQLQWRHLLAPGEMLIFNNWRVLHGRGEFQGRRRMSGCYLNREDFESRLRMLRG